MTLANINSRDCVLEALAEYDRLGRDAFLDKYGFGPSRNYWLIFQGNRYESKAIVGAAHGFARPDLGTLTSAEFTGGENTVANVLRRLGFEVLIEDGPDGARNAPWTRDELILALDLYMTNPKSPPGKSSKAVNELSAILNRLGGLLGREAAGTYRNANGVYMKMMNFRRFDPAVMAAGKVGLQRGNKDEEVIWNEFAADVGRLRRVADILRSTASLPLDEQPPDYDEDEIVEAVEGRILTRLHRTRERSRKLVDRRKKKALAEAGRLECEACGFDYSDAYGDRGEGFIEAHHTRPLHTLEEAAPTKLDELSLLCANCHRMVHAGRPWLSVGELRAIIVARRR